MFYLKSYIFYFNLLYFLTKPAPFIYSLIVATYVSRNVLE